MPTTKIGQLSLINVNLTFDEHVERAIETGVIDEFALVISCLVHSDVEDERLAVRLE